VKIAALILAAGRSSRFEDGHKLLVEIDGVPIVRRVCDAVAASRVDDVFLIVSGTRGPVAQAAGPGRWQVIDNPEAHEGLSTSLRAGLQRISNETSGVLVALADMPGLTTALVNALIAKFSSAPTSIVFPEAHDGRRGHPIIWPSALFSALLAVQGDVGGKAILAQYKTLWNPLPCDDTGAFADIDTRADLRAFEGTDQPTRLR
jgi:molybdenum cofactor cytidylyltransferase